MPKNAKKASGKKRSVRTKDLTPRRNPKGGARNNTIGGARGFNPD